MPELVVNEAAYDLAKSSPDPERLDNPPLKPPGRVLFVEHGRAPEAQVRWWQDSLDPMWKRLAGGCHLNRSIGELIGNAGFRGAPRQRLPARTEADGLHVRGERTTVLKTCFDNWERNPIQRTTRSSQVCRD
jgi:hypothetical protein